MRCFPSTGSSSPIATGLLTRRTLSGAITVTLPPRLMLLASQTIWGPCSATRLPSGCTAHSTREEWAVQPDGSLVAEHGPHIVWLANNINLGGSVTVIAPDNVRLVSNPVAIGLLDPVDGKHLILAEVRDAAPALGAENEIVWPDCFDNVRASIVHRYTR